mmetsp:Transcript_92976/g.240205  ORF Transcript_92976/g.240205 Transcript_92976/m.240205 type:complete len:372 (-) Transcript_92976:126-1241(-)
MGAVCQALCPGVDAHEEQKSEFPGGLTNHAAPEDQYGYESLFEAFKETSGGTGYISDRGMFAELSKKWTRGKTSASIDEVWRELDQDGNGAVNFPEFVEWAERANVHLEVGLPEGQEAGEEGGVTLPHQWTGPRDDPHWNKRIAITDRGELDELQQVMNVSYRKVWTRDRKATGNNKVPSQYMLVKALRNENYADWKRYYVKRHLVAHNCSGNAVFEQREAFTNQVTSFRDRLRLREYCNEWALFHGTKEEAAEAICGGDFTMRLAGSATGTLYGKGTYFAESITKADEYAKEGPDGLCCALICRCVGGRVNYTDEVEPDADALQKSVIAGEYDSVLGDREKCRNTFKEYVIFDADHVYVEYVLYYKRIYD